MPRKYGTRKTTTKKGKAEYMQPYMINYRKQERDMIRQWKQLKGITNGRKVKK